MKLHFVLLINIIFFCTNGELLGFFLPKDVDMDAKVHVGLNSKALSFLDGVSHYRILPGVTTLTIFLKLHLFREACFCFQYACSSQGATKENSTLTKSFSSYNTFRLFYFFQVTSSFFEFKPMQSVFFFFS